jgi:hypothetical protein
VAEQPEHAPATLPERIAFHATMAATLEADLDAERAALHEALIDTLSDRADDGTPKWSHDQILAALIRADHRSVRPDRSAE